MLLFIRVVFSIVTIMSARMIAMCKLIYRSRVEFALNKSLSLKGMNVFAFRFANCNIMQKALILLEN